VLYGSGNLGKKDTTKPKEVNFDHELIMEILLKFD
jgi:hypothetical protein